MRRLEPWKLIFSSFHQRQFQLFHPPSWSSCHLWGLPKLENTNGHSKRIIPLAYHSPTPSNNDCCVIIRKWWPPVPGNFCIVRLDANLKLAPTKEKNFCSFSISWETKKFNNFNLEKKIQGQSLIECPTCHVPPRSDPSALRWKCAGILRVFHQTGSIFQTLISSKHKVIKYFWLMKRSKGRHWEVSKSRVMKFQRIHNQAHHIKNGNTFNITNKWPETIFQAQASRYAWSKRSTLTSSPPSTSSQQLVWSCSPFFTNSMISQLQVPGDIKIKIKNKHLWEKDKDKKCRESTCVVEFAGFEDERQLLPLVII